MRKTLVTDIGIAVAAFAATLFLLLLPKHEWNGASAAAILLAALATLPLAARRRYPLLVLVMTALASAGLFAVAEPEGPPVGPAIALYFVALAYSGHGRQTVRVLGLVVGLLGVHLTAFGLGHDRFPGGEALLGTVLWSGVWVAGDRTRLRRERLRELEERARRAELEAERERRLAAAEERARIARDLHDSAGHAINVILVQAAAARLHQERDPERTRAALETVEEVARDTIGQIDQLVRALRDDATSDEVEPPPGLAALEALADRHRTAGLPVTIDVEGDRRPLSPAVDRTAYRILQEALLNAARHGSGRAGVVIAFGEDAVEISVVNPAGAASSNGGGHGLVGMRERAALLGGTLDAGSSDGVFRVRALLPYGEDRR
ncbi:MAG TPA: histidine kinase [Gaiellaceae bacterium]|nr:histidine kinase [Gaiellaceae bacterium]